MLTAKVRCFRPVRVLQNTTDRTKDRWARIVDCQTGQILHTGQPRYIKKIARKRYNVDTSV